MNLILLRVTLCNLGKYWEVKKTDLICFIKNYFNNYFSYKTPLLVNSNEFDVLN